MTHTCAPLQVIMEYRQSAPEHKEWATALKAFMTKLQSMASSQFPQGLTWVGTAAPGPVAPQSQADQPASEYTDDSAATAAPGIVLCVAVLNSAKFEI